MGSKEIKPFTESELRYRKFQKKSVVAASNLKKGETITRDKVSFIRNTNPGIAPSYFEELVLGKILTSDVKQFENLSAEILSDK